MLVPYFVNNVKLWEHCLKNSYGSITAETETEHNPFKYAGELQEFYGDMVYLRNRIYVPRTGRFLTEDPIRDGTNWYVYCKSNPINFIDPLGLVPSMLSYIAEKNGGSAVYSEKSFFGVPYDKQVTVTINGTTKTYNVGDEISIIDDKSVIDNSVLMNDFGLSEEDSMHQPGDSFDTTDHAALAWGLTYNGESIAFGQEYASAIYDENGKYEYTNPNIGNNLEVITPNAPLGKTLRGLVHSHGSRAYNPVAESFSNNVVIDENGNIKREGDIPIANNRKIPMYLTTPSGKLKKYDYSTDKVTTLNKQMPKY